MVQGKPKPDFLCHTIVLLHDEGYSPPNIYKRLKRIFGNHLPGFNGARRG